MFVQIWVALIIKRSAFPLSLSLSVPPLCVLCCVFVGFAVLAL